MVKINSGGAAGIGTAAALKEPEAPVDADSVQPGKDVTYTKGEELPPGEVPPDQAGITTEAEEEEEDSSWIEIELVNEAGEPQAGERYEIIAPDGETIRRGALDQNGQAHVLIPDAGNCQISFPRLDQAAWDRAGGTTEAAGASGQASSPAGGTPSGTQTSTSGGGSETASSETGGEQEQQTTLGYEEDEGEEELELSSEDEDEGEEDVQT
jgi:hypothetical protein